MSDDQQQPQTQNTPPAPPSPVTFTQEQVNEMMGRARNEGRSAGQKEIADKLGDITADEAAKIIKAAREREESEKTELQKLADENARLKGEGEARSAAQAKQLLDQRIRTQLLMTNLPEASRTSESLGRIAALVSVNADATDAEIAADITKVQAEIPGIWSSSETPKMQFPEGKPSGTPPPQTQTGQSAWERGAELAKSQ